MTRVNTGLLPARFCFIMADCALNLGEGFVLNWVCACMDSTLVACLCAGSSRFSLHPLAFWHGESGR